MPERKKGAMVAMWLGLLFMAAGLLTMLVSIRIPHYTADITEITDTYTTRQLTGSGSKRRYNESVTVSYTDNEGNQKEAAKVRVKRSSESQLPQIGDKIEVKEVFRVSEYSLTVPVAVFISFLLVGIMLVISGLRFRRKARRAELMEQTRFERKRG